MPAVNSETPIADIVSLAYFDHRALTRDCVASQLAVLLPEFSIRRFSSAFEIGAGWSTAQPGCIIFHSHSDSVANPGVAEELSRLRQIISGVPIIILSDLDVTDNVVDAIHCGAVGYIPT